MLRGHCGEGHDEVRGSEGHPRGLLGEGGAWQQIRTMKDMGGCLRIYVFFFGKSELLGSDQDFLSFEGSIEPLLEERLVAAGDLMCRRRVSSTSVLSNEKPGDRLLGGSVLRKDTDPRGGAKSMPLPSFSSAPLGSQKALLGVVHLCSRCEL